MDNTNSVPASIFATAVGGLAVSGLRHPDQATLPEAAQSPLIDAMGHRPSSGQGRPSAGGPSGAAGTGVADAETTLTQSAQARAAQGDARGAVAEAHRALALNPADPAAQAIVAQYADQARAQERVGAGLKQLDFGAARDAGAPSPGGAASAGLGTDGASGRVYASAAASPVQPAATAAGAATTAALGAGPAVRPLLQNAATQLSLGDYSSALLTLQRARNLEPRNTQILDLIARASNEAQNPQGAVAAAVQALALKSDDASALREKAYAEFSLGQYDQALADAGRAVALEPGNGLGYLYRAMIEEKVGRTADARRDYAAAQSLDATLTPLTAQGLKRLGGAGAAALGTTSSKRLLFRGGALAVSTLLIGLGLLGTSAGRRFTTRARGLWAGPVADGGDADSLNAAATVQPGAFIGGHYRVLRELGRGGMGVVFQAFDETLRRPVAIKQLQREGRGDMLELERFLNEARMVAQLKHPHIAEIYSVVGGGDLLLVFEFIEGQSLDRLIEGGRRLPAAQALPLVAQIADALNYAHARKIVHRDLKPANVMIAKSGAAKVMDFGIAHQSRSGAAATRTNFVSGTPPYMSPEQMMGSVSPAADVYALGVMTYELLTGCLPFDGPDYMEQKLARRYPPASSLDPTLPPPVDALLARALEPDATKRLTDAGTFARELAAAFAGAPGRT